MNADQQVAISRYLLPALTGVLMAGCAELSGERALLFPESVALSFGVWSLRRVDWCAVPRQIVLAPSLSAAGGVLIAGSVPSRAGAELLALVWAATVLIALPARIGPALSAAVLPAVFGITSWLYPLAVLVITVGVMAGYLVSRTEPARQGGTPLARRFPLTTLAPALVAAAMWIAAANALGLPHVAVAPPLMVSCLEWVTGPRPSARTGAARGTLLVAAWLAGAIAVWWISPPVLAAAAALAVTSTLVRASRMPHAPALAMGMVAQVSGPSASWAALARGASGIALAVLALYVTSSLVAGFITAARRPRRCRPALRR